jgi:hypothetical protein
MATIARLSSRTKQAHRYPELRDDALRRVATALCLAVASAVDTGDDQLVNVLGEIHLRVIRQWHSSAV